MHPGCVLMIRTVPATPEAVALKATELPAHTALLLPLPVK
jgi:hypothetical protein